MNKKYSDMIYIFHSTQEYADLINSFVIQSGLDNCEVISDEKKLNHIF